MYILSVRFSSFFSLRRSRGKLKINIAIECLMRKKHFFMLPTPTSRIRYWAGHISIRVSLRQRKKFCLREYRRGLRFLPFIVCSEMSMPSGEMFCMRLRSIKFLSKENLCTFTPISITANYVCKQELMIKRCSFGKHRWQLIRNLFLDIII